VRADRLVDSGMPCQATYNTGCLMPIHPIPGVRNEDWTFGSFTNREIHRACRPRCKWHDHGVAALAHDSQCVVASFEAKIINVGTDCFRGSQPVQGQQTCQGMIPRTGQASLDKEGSEFVSI
jgi:hypothetical protein